MSGGDRVEMAFGSLLTLTFALYILPWCPNPNPNLQAPEDEGESLRLLSQSRGEVCATTPAAAFGAESAAMPAHRP